MDLPGSWAVEASIRALGLACSGGQTLPGPAYCFIFPILRGVLGWHMHTSLHDRALAVLARHATPHCSPPLADSLALLYHLLAVIPAYRWAVVWEVLGSGVLYQILVQKVYI